VGGAREGGKGGPAGDGEAVQERGQGARHGARQDGGRGSRQQREGQCGSGRQAGGDSQKELSVEESARKQGYKGRQWSCKACNGGRGRGGPGTKPGRPGRGTGEPNPEGSCAFDHRARLRREGLTGQERAATLGRPRQTA